MSSITSARLRVSAAARQVPPVPLCLSSAPALGRIKHSLHQGVRSFRSAAGARDAHGESGRGDWGERYAPVEFAVGVRAKEEDLARTELPRNRVAEGPNLIMLNQST